MGKPGKKTRVYECEHYRYEYDGFDKYAWCRSRECLSRECVVDYVFCQDLCPFYRKNDKGRYVEIEDDKRCREIRAGCRDKLQEAAAEALKEGEKALESAAAKMEYARRLQAAVPVTVEFSRPA